MGIQESVALWTEWRMQIEICDVKYYYVVRYMQSCKLRVRNIVWHRQCVTQSVMPTIHAFFTFLYITLQENGYFSATAAQPRLKRRHCEYTWYVLTDCVSFNHCLLFFQICFTDLSYLYARNTVEDQVERGTKCTTI